MPLQDFSFALVALAFSSALMHTQVSHCSCLSSVHQKFPGQLDAASALAFCPVALIYHSTLSHLQVSSFARLSAHKPKFPSQMDAAPEVQLSLSNAMFRPPCPSLLIQWGGHLNISFAFFCASCRGRSPFQAGPKLSFSQRARSSASEKQPLPWAQPPKI